MHKICCHCVIANYKCAQTPYADVQTRDGTEETVRRYGCLQPTSGTTEAFTCIQKSKSSCYSRNIFHVGKSAKLEPNLNLLPSFLKLLEISADMESNKQNMEHTDSETDDISFEELLAQEKKDSFW